MDNNTEHFDEVKLEQLKNEHEKVTPSASLEDKVAAALKQQRLIRKWYEMRSIKIAAGMLILVCAFFAGRVTAPDNTQSAIAEDNRPSYLALLYDTDNFVKNDNQVAEYGAWMHRMYSSKITIHGAELKDNGWTLNKEVVVNNPATGVNGKVSGYFIMQASTEKDALQVMTSCPHLKYNGTVELRPLTAQ